MVGIYLPYQRALLDQSSWNYQIYRGVHWIAPRLPFRKLRNEINDGKFGPAVHEVEWRCKIT